MELNSDETLSTPCYIALQSQVQFLDSQSAQLKILLKAFQTNLNNLKSLLSRTKVRIKSLKKETTDCTTLLQSLPSTLSKSYSEEICRIKNPNTTLVNIAEKLLEILQQPDKSWKNFKILMKSNALLRHLMENARPIVIPSESLSEMVLIWTNYGATQGKLLKYSKGVGIIAEWVKSAVEYKVKQDLYEASMQEHSKYKEKVDFLKHKIASVKAQIASIEKSIFQVKTAFEGFNQKFTDDAAETFDFSYSSPKAATRRKISISPLTKGTASGGILHSSSSISVPLLPNFQVNNEENHYNSHTFEDDLSVRLDHSLEKIGCCRSNFFCF